jgi:septal ring factor EnvC (AmiA/AmiB activator)
MLSALTAFGQKSAKVREWENQRKAALAEIEMTNQLLAETKRSTQNSLNRLNLLSQQILSRKKIINLLNREMAAIDKEMAVIRIELTSLEKELGIKRDNYGKSVQRIHRRHTSQDKLLFILSADNFSQSLRRMRYLREYADWQKKQAGEIVKKQEEVNLKRQELEKTRAEKQQLLNAREAESKKLEQEEATQKREVQQLNRKQKQLQDELKKKQRQADALNRQIEKQIAEEIAHAEAEVRSAREREREKVTAEGKKTPEPATSERVADTKGGYAMTKAEKTLSTDFVNNRGRLPMPVSGQYRIVGTFGEQQHPELPYVRIDNSGIDIQTTAGADACAIFNGEVTRIFIIPGYNNSIIVRHGNYLTVYSNLSKVYVQQGEKVKTRQMLGKIFTDTENDNSTILNFQLRKEKDKLNPLLWLDN